MATGGKALPRLVSGEPIVEKHLIHNQRQPVFPAQSFERGPLLIPGEMAGRIIGVDDRNRPGADGDPAAQRLEVKMPAMIVEKLIRNQPHVIQLGQEIKQRVPRLADQYFIPGVAEQAEEKTVGLAGAGGEKDLFRVDPGSMVAVIAADRLARREKAPGIRFIAQGFRIAKRTQNGGYIVGKAANRRVGGGQVPESRAGCA